MNEKIILNKKETRLCYERKIMSFEKAEALGASEA